MPLEFSLTRPILWHHFISSLLSDLPMFSLKCLLYSKSFSLFSLSLFLCGSSLLHLWIIITSSLVILSLAFFLSIFYAHSCSIFFLKYCFNHGFSTMSIKHTGSFFTKSGISTYYSVYLVSSQSLQASQAFSDP